MIEQHGTEHVAGGGPQPARRHLAQAAEQGLELYDPLFHTPQEDLYEVYARLRSLYPVYHNRARDVWCLTRYADVQAAARDWKTFSNLPGVDIDSPNYMGPGNFLDSDPPRHDLLRDVVRPFFLPRVIAQLQADVTRRVETMIQDVRDRGTVDLARDFALRLPTWAIARLLGAPEHDDDEIQRMLLDVYTRYPGEAIVPEIAERGLAQLKSYVADLAEQKRQHPDDRVMSRLVAGQADGTPTREETVGMATLLFIAGSETTFALLTNALYLFSRYSKVVSDLRQDRSEELMDQAIEEVLRFESVTQYLARTVVAPTTIHGIEIPQGACLILVYGAANRDPEHWEHPEHFDIHRPVQRHLAFGAGIHFCLGAPLARLEARIALTAFLRNFKNYDILSSKRLNSHIVRGWEYLEARLEPSG